MHFGAQVNKRDLSSFDRSRWFARYRNAPLKFMNFENVLKFNVKFQKTSPNLFKGPFSFYVFVFMENAQKLLAGNKFAELLVTWRWFLKSSPCCSPAVVHLCFSLQPLGSAALRHHCTSPRLIYFSGYFEWNAGFAVCSTGGVAGQAPSCCFLSAISVGGKLSDRISRGCFRLWMLCWLQSQWKRDALCLKD